MINLKKVMPKALLGKPWILNPGNLMTLPLIVSLSFLFVACSESTQTPDSGGTEIQIQDESEDAGDALEEAGDDAGNALEDAGDDAGNALEDAKNATEEGLDDAGNAVKEGVGEAGSALEEAGDSVKDATN